MGISAKIFKKKNSRSHPTVYKRIIHNDQVGFIAVMQIWFNV